MPSFDIVSEVNSMEVENAVNQARKELANRFDFKGSHAGIALEKNQIQLSAEDQFKIKALVEILISKLAKRQVSLKNVDKGEPELSPLGHARQVITIKQGLGPDVAKQVSQFVRETKLKVSVAIEGTKVRVSGKSKDELQRVITRLRQLAFPPRAFMEEMFATRSAVARADERLESARAAFYRLVDERAEFATQQTRLIIQLPMFRSVMINPVVAKDVATVAEMAELRRRIDTPIAADEVVRQSPHPLQVIEEGAADVLVLKVQPIGGVGRVLDLARRSPIPVVISSALETSVGMYGGLLAASLLPELPFACGLGTVALLEGDPTMLPLVPKDGMLEVRRPEPDQDLLERWRPGRGRAAEMLRKLRAAAEVLT